MSQTRSPRSTSEERIEDGLNEPGWRDRLNQHPMAPYYLILGAAMLLLVLGLVMVLSSSGSSPTRSTTPPSPCSAARRCSR